MNTQNVVWLASYPRSGNTFLRTILWHCFGLRSASIYPGDLGSNRSLEKYVGHIEHDVNKKIVFPAENLPLVKTHEYPFDNSMAIYIVRDGRAAAVSLWQFYNREMSLRDVIEGKHRFGTWSDHLAAWEPWSRPDTLLLKYEQIRDDLPAVLKDLSDFLKRDVLSEVIPDRDDIADKDGQWVRVKSEWRTEFSDETIAVYDRVNKEMHVKMGY